MKISLFPIELAPPCISPLADPGIEPPVFEVAILKMSINHFNRGVRVQRNLMTTGGTFVQISCSNPPIFFSMTFGTYKSLRPARSIQPINAIVFKSKFFLEYHPTHISVIGLAPLTYHENHSKKKGELSPQGISLLPDLNP